MSFTPDYAWASLKGYANDQTVVFWNGVMTAGGWPEPLATSPVVGDIVGVRLQALFTSGEAPFWAIYETPAAFWNGPEMDGDDLAGLSLIKSRLVTPPTRPDGQVYSIASAQVLETIGLADLANGPWTGDAEPGLRLRMETGPGAFSAKQGSYTYMSRNFEGDLGDWAVFHEANQEVALLVFAEWGSKEDRMWAGRARVR